MNKTVSIHLGGTHFNVEEPAYEVLKKYLDSIQRHFSNEEGHEEILADIEARLAELLLERQTSEGRVFTYTDIHAVIQIMGNPEEFGDDTESSETANQDASRAKKVKRRVYRDTDQNVLGGVCSGFGYYFGIDPIWFRLAFVLFFLFAGSGFLFYLVLWLIVPPARSTAEKLEMRGEAINIDTIQRSIQEELNSIKSKISEFDNNTARHRGKLTELIGDFGRLLLNLLQYLIRFISRFFGLILIIIGASLLITFVSWLIGFGDAITSISDDTAIGFDTLEIARLLFSSDALFQLTTFLLALVVILPLLQFISSGIRILFKLDKPNPWIPRVGGLLTLIAALGLLTISAIIFRDFRTRMPFTETVTIETDSLETIQVRTDNYEDLPVQLHSDRPIYIDPDHREIYLKRVEWSINPSPAPENFVEIEGQANARDKRMARERAKKIEYPYDFDGGDLEFKPYFILPPNTTWRNQQVKITLYLKEGQKIYLDESMLDIIYDLPNVHDMYDGDMIDHYWQMTRRGLECMDCREFPQEESEDRWG